MGFRECPQEVLKSLIILTQRRIFCKTLSFLFKKNLVPGQVSGERRQMFSGDEVWSPCCRDRKEGSIFEDVSSNSLKHRYSLLFTCQSGCIIYWRYFPYRVNFLSESHCGLWDQIDFSSSATGLGFCSHSLDLAAQRSLQRSQDNSVVILLALLLLMVSHPFPSLSLLSKPVQCLGSRLSWCSVLVMLTDMALHLGVKIKLFPRRPGIELLHYPAKIDTTYLWRFQFKLIQFNNIKHSVPWLCISCG